MGLYVMIRVGINAALVREKRSLARERRPFPALRPPPPPPPAEGTPPAGDGACSWLGGCGKNP